MDELNKKLKINLNNSRYFWTYGRQTDDNDVVAETGDNENSSLE
jgi:hypothetical protein